MILTYLDYRLFSFVCFNQTHTQRYLLPISSVCLYFLRPLGYFIVEILYFTFWSKLPVLWVAVSTNARGQEHSLQLHKLVRNSTICAETTNEVLQIPRAAALCKIAVAKGLWLHPAVEKYNEARVCDAWLDGDAPPLPVNYWTRNNEKQWMEQHVVGCSRTGCELRPIEDFLSWVSMRWIKCSCTSQL